MAENPFNSGNEGYGTKLNYLPLEGVKLLLEQPDANTPKGQEGTWRYWL